MTSSATHRPHVGRLWLKSLSETSKCSSLKISSGEAMLPPRPFSKMH